jgi:kynurenine formamidase
MEVIMFNTCKETRKRNTSVSKKIGVITLLFVATSQVNATQTNTEHTIQYRSVVSLSHPISESIPLWPGDPKVHFETVATMEKDGYKLRSWTIGEHSATHMNAPDSFIEGNHEGIDTYPADSLVHQAVVINVKDKVKGHPDYVITTQDVQQWEKIHGNIPKNTLVFFDTGWGKLWNTPKAFINVDSQGALHFPGIDGKTTEYLLKQRHIAGMGIDTHGLDPSASEIYETNVQLAENHKIALECVANLDEIPATGSTVVIGLPQLHNGSGAPVSITAFVP